MDKNTSNGTKNHRNLFALAAVTVLASLTLVGCGKSYEPAAKATPEPRATNGFYTATNVAAHSTPDDCWTIVGDKVYDLSGFGVRHPGGEDRIAALCGTDATERFYMQHAMNDGPKSYLASMVIGTLATEATSGTTPVVEDSTTAGTGGE